MKSIVLPFEVKSPLLRRLILIFLLSWMASYSIYTSYYKAYAVEQYERYQAHIAGNSMFFNPWQYRVLCPLLIQGLYEVADATVYKVVEVKGINLPVQGNVDDKNANTKKLLESLRDPEFVKHTLVFLGFRFLQGILVLILAYHYLAVFVKSNNLRWLALIIITLATGNGVVDSDLTFNTYADIIFYLLAGLVIAKKMNDWWIVPITIFGAMNRETSVFIPALYFFSRVDWSVWPNFLKTFFSDRKAVMVTAVCAVVYVSIFVSIRAYYGYQPQQTWRVGPGWPMFKLNMLGSASVKTYSEFFGVFAFFPLWALFVLKQADYRLKVFFWVLVPVWFALHIFTAIAFQTRLFLVPTLLVIIPIVFEYIDRSFINPISSRTALQQGG